MPHGNSFMVGQWTVEPDLDRISRGGEKRALRPQVMELLVYLARRGGEVCRSEELLTDLWPNKVVTDATLYNCVAELRHQLDEGADGPGYIQTIPKKGYRLLAPVGGLQDASELDQPESPNSEAHAASQRMGSKIAADLAAGGRRIDLVIIVILAAALILGLTRHRSPKA